MTKTKSATKHITKIERKKFERMFAKDPLVSLVNEEFEWLHNNDIHARGYKMNENSIFRIDWTPRDRIQTRILEFGILQEYVREPYTFSQGSLKPVHIKDSNYDEDVGFAMTFEKPKRGENVSEILMGIGFCGRYTFNRLTESSNLWPWSEADIYLRMEDGKPNTFMYFNGIECETREYALRGIGQQLYRIILREVIERGGQDKGLIHHRYEECDTFPILDNGGQRLERLPIL